MYEVFRWVSTRRCSGRNPKLSENDDVKALKYDRGISLELAHVYQFRFEKARLEHNKADEVRFTKQALWFFKNSVGGKLATEYICKVNQNLAVKALHEEKNGVLGFRVGHPHRKAWKYIEKSHLDWRRMIRMSKNNLKHSRYLSHLVYRNYLKYEIKPNLKYLTKIWRLFLQIYLL